MKSRNTVSVKGKVWNQLGSILIEATMDALPALPILGNRHFLQGQAFKKSKSERPQEKEEHPKALVIRLQFVLMVLRVSLK